MLVFWNLGRPALWLDEAHTAVVARNILEQGVPAASDGKNLVSIFPDHRDVRSGIYIWQGWLPTYLAAGSMAVWGRDAFGARFPFALCFVALIGFLYAFLRRWSVLPQRHSWLTIGLTLTCVPLLLHARQCRYYILVPLLYLLVIDAYLSAWKDQKPRHWLLLVAWSTALVNSFFPGAAVLAVALAIDLIRRRPTGRTRAGFAVSAAVILLVNLPMAWFCRIWDRRFAGEAGYDDPAVFGMFLARYLLTLNDYLFPLGLAALACAVQWKSIAQRRFLRDDLGFLFAVVCATQLVGFALLADFPFTRYVIGIVPFLMFFGARCVEAVAFERTALVWLLALAVAVTNALHVLPLPLLRRTDLQNARWTTAGVRQDLLEPGRIKVSFARGEIKELINVRLGSPLWDYLHSIADPPTGPIDVIVEHLARNAAPTDRVKISYGDLPLMFHTELSVVSAADVGDPAPEWMIFRHFGLMSMDREFVRATASFQYAEIRLPFPDLQWNNQPDPVYHYYYPPSDALAPPIVLLRRR